ncbi:GNAT family N-acetyltransferase [Paenibacillaceae bacterium WGS1546]|uniref:GNAT family N-acetyltransferase n=1 Tax=Cohnella sp. WGS1546 TaxID=3366810 RepID=UPI00372CF6D1
MELQLRSAQLPDLDLLAAMNKELIDDEGNLNPMNAAQLTERMREWLVSDWQADLLLDEQEAVIGYALYQFRKHSYFPEMKTVYLRQYFIRREHRRQGYGLKGIELLRKLRFAGVDRIELDVLYANDAATKFWRRAGFDPYAVQMTLDQEKDCKDIAGRD